MAKRVKPRWGWRSEWSGPDFDERLSRVDNDKTAREFGATSLDQRERFSFDLLMTFRVYHDRDNPFPSNAQIKAALNELATSAGRLRFAMENLDDMSRWTLNWNTEVLLERTGSDYLRGPSEDEFTSVEDLPMERAWSETLRFIKLMESAAIEQHLEVPKGRPGRPRPPLLDLIWRLAAIYQEHSGRSAYAGFSYDPDAKQYGGAFFLIVEDALSAFEPEETRTNNALGEAIRRAIGDRAPEQWRNSLTM